MDGIYKLKETLCKELEEYGNRSSLDSNSLNVVDTLAHALKNVNKVIESKNGEEYSSRGYSMGTIEDGMGHYHWPQYTRYSERRSMDDGMSNRMSRRYSRDDGVMDALGEAMSMTDDDGTKNEIRKLMTKLNNR